MSPVVVRLPPVLLLLVILHTAVFPQFRVFDVGADVLLLAGVTAAIVGGPERGAAVGFGTGLLADCFLQTPFGLSALVFCLVGWWVGALQAHILHTTWWIPLLTVAAASGAGTLLYAGFGAVLGEAQLVSWRLLTIAGVVAVMNGALAPLAVRVMRWSLDADTDGAILLRT